jgi:hypothetical protein
MLSSNTSAVSGDANYIEDVFSTYLYTGNGSTQSITNNIDLSTKGGLVWFKGRSGATSHELFDTARGVGSGLTTNSTAASSSGGLTAFNTNGFSIEPDSWINTNAATYASWTFRKQPKFFDVVTFTGNNTQRDIAHSLGSTPGCIIIKQTSGSGDYWYVWHRSLASTKYIVLNDTGAAYDDPSGVIFGNPQNMNSATFRLGDNGGVNESGETFVAYLFAHDAGGFGLTGTDNVISCNTFTTDGSGNATVSLGYEPQWLIMKGTTAGQPWWHVNNMSGFVASPVTTTRYLVANSTDAEASWGSVMAPTATGFIATGLAASTSYVYIAIRRGPMKVPTDGTKVFNTVLNTGNATAKNVTGTGFPPDLLISGLRTSTSGYQHTFQDRLRGAGQHIGSTLTDAEVTDAASLSSFLMDGVRVGTDGSRNLTNQTGRTYAFWQFKRAPSFFDEVCWSGNGTAGRTLNHNLTVAPELVIVKVRSTTFDWQVYTQFSTSSKLLFLSTTDAATTINPATDGDVYSPTATTFRVSGAGVVNRSGDTYVSYLFATCAGVSKVGSYTGTGTTKQVDCGFAAGARFVLIKRTDSTGAWYVWDTARGIVSGNDPYLLLNSLAAEVTTTDYIDTYSAGFELSSTAPAALNASGGSYIFLAIA